MCSKPDAKTVFNAARENKLHRLRILMSQLLPDEVPHIVNSKTSGATPLLMACRNGFLDITKFLVMNCKADIELAGSVVFGGETIEGAPPLWCAAAAGHDQIVQFLVYEGANVNSTTQTNSTPLRAACFDGHFNIVQFLVKKGADIEMSNRHGHTCLMIACYNGHYRVAKYLLSLRADVNRKSVKGNTALHDCAESGNLVILKLLIANGAKMDVDSYGMTPLLAASVTGHTAIVEYVIDKLGTVTRHEVIDALELLGATHVDKGRNMHVAYELWRKAMVMRYDPQYDPVPKPTTTSPVEAYEFAREVKSLEELQELISDPDAMRVQALLIRERILGPAHPDTSYYIRFRGAVYADAGRFSRCISLWNYALDMQQSILEPLNPLTQSSLVSFTELFSLMMDADSPDSSTGSRKIPTINFDDIATVLRKCVREVASGAAIRYKAGFEESHFQRVLIIALHLCCVLAKLLPSLTAEQKHRAHTLVYALVKVDIERKQQHRQEQRVEQAAAVAAENGCRSLLHYVCSHRNGVISRYSACQFPCPKLVHLLCQTGADANARDERGNTPLHLIAASNDCLVEMAQVLLAHGAHLDAVNDRGKTFKDILTSVQKLHSIANEVQYTSLACLAARVVRRNRIPFENVIPEALYEFVLQH